MVSGKRYFCSQIAALVLSASCWGAELHVAAAANLNQALLDIDKAFEAKTRIHVVPTFGATAQLTQQIENGAPFDVFMAADVDHADELVSKGFGEAKALYARGQLIVWAPAHPELKTLAALTEPKIRVIVIAKPELAPYGAAAVETLKQAGLWDRVQSKVVYAPSVSVAKQFADTGNGDAAFTASSLTKDPAFIVDEKLHQPIDQALCIVKASKEKTNASTYLAFLASPEAKAILKSYGYI
jgi:molybdate transport system substrate-binding protein